MQFTVPSLWRSNSIPCNPMLQKHIRDISGSRRGGLDHHESGLLIGDGCYLVRRRSRFLIILCYADRGDITYEYVRPAGLLELLFHYIHSRRPIQHGQSQPPKINRANFRHLYYLIIRRYLRSCDALWIPVQSRFVCGQCLGVGLLKMPVSSTLVARDWAAQK